MRMLPRSLRRVAGSAAVTVALAGAGAGVVGLAAPAAASHVGTITVTQVGGQGAYVTLQVDLTYTGASGGGGLFQWATGDGRSSSIADGVSNGTYLGDASGTGNYWSGSGVLGTYSWSRTQPAANVARTRLTYAYAEAGAYAVTWSGCCPEATGSTPVSVAASLPPCSNTLDDDGDGNVDYPTDPGCESPDDYTEGPECPPFAAGIIVCLSPGAEVQPVVVYSPDVTVEPWVTVAGYLDAYRFSVGTVAVTLPCVTPTASIASGVSPCAVAGGVFVERTATLASAEVPIPVVGPGPAIAAATICQAELVVTVNEFGVNSAPAYTLCEAGEQHL